MKSFKPSFVEDIIPQNGESVNEPIYKTVAKADKIQHSVTDIKHLLYQTYIAEGKAAKAHNVLECGTFLQFKQHFDPERTARLTGANFCKSPLCPMCAWRRHVKYYAILDKAVAMSNKHLYHLVLAVPNFDEICKADLTILKERGRTFLTKQMGIKSYISNLEITNKENGYHPHLHILFENDKFIQVTSDYIKKQAEHWRLWYERQAARNHCREYDGYTFFLQGVKRDDDGLCAELTKYIVKSEMPLTLQCFRDLSLAVHGVRKMSAGGDLKAYINAAKAQLRTDYGHELARLSAYDYEIQIFNYINGRYKKID